MKKSVNPQVKKKHKSQFDILSKIQLKQSKPKRVSCMITKQLLAIEESSEQNAKYAIQQLLKKTFEQIEIAQQMSKISLNQLSQKVNLLQSMQIYSMDMNQQPLNFTLQISIEPQPKTQYKHQVIQKKQKPQHYVINPVHKNPLAIPFLSNSYSSNFKSNKLLSKQKLSKLSTSIYGSINNNSISSKSIKSNRGNINSFSVNSYRLNGRIEQERQTSRQKQKRQKQQIIKKLMRQYQYNLKQTKHCCPQPIQQNYRSFFTQPQTRQQQDLRTSFLHLRQLRQQQQNQIMRKTKKYTKILNDSSNISSKNQTERTTKLPTINNKSSNIANNKNIKKQQGNNLLFTQDENGKVIKIKNQQRIDTLTRQYSLTTHQTLQKPKQTPFKEISNTQKVKFEYLKNDRIKYDLNDNSSIVSTLCQTVDEDMMDRSIIQSFKQNSGAKLKKCNYSHRPSMSTQFQSGAKLSSFLQHSMKMPQSFVQRKAVKFPTINMKKT